MVLSHTPLYARDQVGRPLRPPRDAQHGHPRPGPGPKASHILVFVFLGSTTASARSSLQPTEPQTRGTSHSHTLATTTNHDGDVDDASSNPPPTSDRRDSENDDEGDLLRPSYSTTAKPAMGVAVTASIDLGPMSYEELATTSSFHIVQEILPTPLCRRLCVCTTRLSYRTNWMIRIRRSGRSVRRRRRIYGRNRTNE